MTPPTCPTHGTPLSPPKGKGFSWYCAKKMPDGSWCPYKVKAQSEASTPSQAPIAQPGASQGPQTLSDEAIRLRIWESMAKLFTGSGLPDEAVHHARKAYEWIKNG